MSLAEIAAGLTPIQRKWISRAVLSSAGPFIIASSRMDHSIRTRLYREGILGPGIGGFCALSPLGEQVRNYLKDQSSDR